MKTQTKHTPGPWKCTIVRFRPEHPAAGFAIEATGKIPYLASANAHGPDHVLIVDESSRKYITTGYTPEEVEANAHLIASAPAMLEALKDCEQSLARLPDVDGAYRVTVLQMARKAIRQAEGTA